MRIIRVVGLLSLVIAGGVGAVLWYDAAHEKRPGLTLYGNVDIRQVDLAFNVDGRVLHLFKEEGDPVKAGELLAELEPETYRNLVEVADGRVAAQKAILDKAIAGNRKEDIDRMEAEVQLEKAVLANAETTLARKSELLNTPAGLRQTYDDTKALVEESRARVIIAQKAADVMRLGSRNEDITSARATLSSEMAAANLARIRLEHTKLLAPANGTILTRITEPGAVLGPSSPVYSVALTDQLWVRSFVPETSLGRVKPGQKVWVKTDSRPDQPYEGYVGYIAPTAEFTPKTVETPDLRTQLVYRLRVFIKNPDSALRQGMPVTITFDGQAS